MERMLAYQYEEIAEDDIVITSDTDIFVMEEDIFKDLKRPFKVN